MPGYMNLPDGRRFEVPEPTPEQLREIFTPYGTALGHVAYSWNRLHDVLAQLFATCLTPIPDRPSATNSSSYRMAMAVWQSVTSDYTQREMLRSLITAPDATISREQGTALKRVLDEIDNSLRHKRNSALHAPLMFTVGLFDDAVKTIVEPNIWTPNPHAKALRTSITKRSSGNDTFGQGELIAEFNWYAEVADALLAHSIHILTNLTDREHALPDKLTLPQPPPVKSQKA
jgi:hypothetical protein